MFRNKTSFVTTGQFRSPSFFIFMMLASFAIIIVKPYYPVYATQSAQETSSVRPLVTIDEPAYSPALTYDDTITINGTSYDALGSGISKIEAFVHTFPFNFKYPYRIVEPLENDWSRWTFAVNLNSTGVFRVSVHIVDNLGNENWAEILINYPFNLGERVNDKLSPRVAIIDNTFTDAAYSKNAFYTFYAKHKDARFNVTSDLQMLTAQLLAPNMTASAWTQGGNVIEPQTTSIANFTNIAQRMADYFPNPVITVLNDQDVHNGYIFYPPERNVEKNIYDVLLLTHNEYVTQQEYDYFKRFVANGGKIIFINANTFYAQVSYNEANQTVTLVKGHDWEYDGKTARKSVSERWFDESMRWIGSNYWITTLDSPIIFESNPFDYKHFEEQYITNYTDITIIQDYRAVNLGEGPQYQVATYEKNYGEGKVIVLGLFAERLANNTRFLKFFNDIIIPRAFGSQENVLYEGKDYPSFWISNSGATINGIQTRSNSPVTISIDVDSGVSSSNSKLDLIIPTALLLRMDPSLDMNKLNITKVTTASGSAISENISNQTITDSDVALTLQLDSSNPATSKIDIIVTSPLSPETQLSRLIVTSLILIGAGVAGIILYLIVKRSERKNIGFVR
jgi:hypothetical protein